MFYLIHKAHDGYRANLTFPKSVLFITITDQILTYNIMKNFT